MKLGPFFYIAPLEFFNLILALTLEHVNWDISKCLFPLSIYIPVCSSHSLSTYLHHLHITALSLPLPDFLKIFPPTMQNNSPIQQVRVWAPKPAGGTQTQPIEAWVPDHSDTHAGRPWKPETADAGAFSRAQKTDAITCEPVS